MISLHKEICRATAAALGVPRSTFTTMHMCTSTAVLCHLIQCRRLFTIICRPGCPSESHPNLIGMVLEAHVPGMRIPEDSLFAMNHTSVPLVRLNAGFGAHNTLPHAYFAKWKQMSRASNIMPLDGCLARQNCILMS